MSRPNTDVTIHEVFFENCRKGVRLSMQLIASKESLNINDVQALKILGSVYEAMLDPAPENTLQILEDCSKISRADQ